MTDYFVNNLDPVLLQLGPLAVRWYGVMYVLGLFIGMWWLGRRQAKGLFLLEKKEQVQDVAFYAFMGLLAGGRIGECLLYDPAFYFAHPLAVLKVWEGGMSFHGGMVGAACGLVIYARRYKVPFLHLLDNVAICATPGLGLGRVANFINSELHGKVTDVAWAVIFPKIDSLPRHPVQLYQALTDGVILLLIMWICGRKPRQRGFLSGVFGIGYGVLRILTEPFRAEEKVLAGWFGMTKGQVYSVLTLTVGAALVIYSLKQPVDGRSEA